MTEAICATCAGYEPLTDVLGECAIPPHHCTPGASTCQYHDANEERFWERHYLLAIEPMYRAIIEVCTG